MEQETVGDGVRNTLGQVNVGDQVNVGSHGRSEEWFTDGVKIKLTKITLYTHFRNTPTDL